MGVSVIVPVYQVEQYLKQCVDSILNQTFCDIEIILVDDGSYDNSGKICDDYQKKDYRVKSIHKENGGLMSAWLKGLEFAKYEYITFVDSDDWIEKDMIEQLVCASESTNADMVCCNFLHSFPNRDELDCHPVGSGIYDKDDIRKKIYPKLINNKGMINRSIRLTRWAKLIKKQLILQNIHYCNPEISMGEDLNIMFPVVLQCNKICILNDKGLYHYRCNESSIVKKYNKDEWIQVWRLFSALKTINEANMDYDFSEQITFNLFEMLVNTLNKEATKSTFTSNWDAYSENVEAVALLRSIASADRFNPKLNPSNRLIAVSVKYNSKVLFLFARILIKTKMKLR